MPAPKGWGMEDEQRFRYWYEAWSSYLGLDPDPDNPLHYYDWRSAYSAGALPDETGHWPSAFKMPEHPNRYVGGIDTITGERIQK